MAKSSLVDSPFNRPGGIASSIWTLLLIAGCNDPSPGPPPDGESKRSGEEVLYVTSPNIVELFGGAGNDKVTIPFRIRNPSVADDLHLKTVRRSCMCIDVDIKKAVLGPCEESSITALLRVKPGVTDVKIDVTTNVLNPRLVSLRSQVTGLPEFEVLPNDFGLVTVGDHDAPIRVEVIESARSQTAWESSKVSIKSSENDVLVTDHGATIDELGDFVQRRSVFGLSLPQRRISGTVHTCKVWVANESRTVSRTLSWRDASQVEVAPSTLVVFSSEMNEQRSFRKEVVLLSRQEFPMNVAYASANAVSEVGSRQSNTTWELRVDTRQASRSECRLVITGTAEGDVENQSPVHKVGIVTNRRRRQQRHRTSHIRADESDL